MDGFGNLLVGLWAALGRVLGDFGCLLNAPEALGGILGASLLSWTALVSILEGLGMVFEGSGKRFGGSGDVLARILEAFGVILTCFRTS